jgi:hypothetical protein
MTTTAPPVVRPLGAPPWSRALRLTAGVCLVLAGLLNGLPQFLMTLLTGDLSFGDQIAWSAAHPGAHRLEQTALLVSSLVLLPGLLGLAHVCRFSSPRLTAVATPLVVWGMWGFGNVLAMGYVSGTVAPSVVGVDDAVRLNDALSGDPGVVAAALVPHLLGSFLGVLLLGVAAWRAGFPKPAVVLSTAFLVWDFLLPPLGPIDAHLLLVVAWAWLGVALLRLPDAAWNGGIRAPAPGPAAGPARS